MVCESNENLVVDINIELSTKHLNDVLGNHEVDGGNGLQKMCQAVDRTRILRSALLQCIGLFDRCFIDSVAGMTAKAEASTDDNELGAIVRSDIATLLLKTRLITTVPTTRIYSESQTTGSLTATGPEACSRRVEFSERSHTITKTVGSKPAARTASKSTSTRGWPASTWSP